MIKIKKTSIRRTRRTDPIILLRQKYEGDLHDNPRDHNRAFADILRQMADAIENVKDAWATPEVIVWTHVEGEITAELMLSPPSDGNHDKT